MAHLIQPSSFRYFMAWAVHIFTASAAFIGILTLVQIYEHHYLQALWLMGITVAIDALDGTFARLMHVKTILPHMDGALLDNMADYVNYVITPGVFLLIKPDMLPPHYATWIILAITITSSYQFCQADAKTPDHFFKGFPCYWNFAVFYMFVFNTQASLNAVILMSLCCLIFVPIKYVYPSRLDYLTDSIQLKRLMHACSATYALCSGLILWHYPRINPVLLWISLSYVMMYLMVSFYRTYSPMIRAKIVSVRKS